MGIGHLNEVGRPFTGSERRKSRTDEQRRQKPEDMEHGQTEVCQRIGRRKKERLKGLRRPSHLEDDKSVSLREWLRLRRADQLVLWIGAGALRDMVEELVASVHEPWPWEDQ